MASNLETTIKNVLSTAKRNFDTELIPEEDLAAILQLPLGGNSITVINPDPNFQSVSISPLPPSYTTSTVNGNTKFTFIPSMKVAYTVNHAFGTTCDVSEPYPLNMNLYSTLTLSNHRSNINSGEIVENFSLKSSQDQIVYYVTDADGESTFSQAGLDLLSSIKIKSPIELDYSSCFFSNLAGFSGDFSFLDLSECISINYMFYNLYCSTLNLSGCDLSKAKQANYAFSNIFSFKNPSILNLNNTNFKPTTLQCTFYKSAISKLLINDLDTSLCSQFSGCFEDSIVMEAIIPNGLDLSSANSIYSMFEGASFGNPIHLKNVPASLIKSGTSSADWELTYGDGTRGVHYVIDSVKA